MLDREEFFSVFSDNAEKLAADEKAGLLLLRVQRLGEVSVILDNALANAVQLRIKKSLRSRDFCARLGECDFVICLAELKNLNHAALAANSLVRAFHEPIRLESGPVQITVVIGIAVCPDHGNEPTMLCRQAEVAFARAMQSSDHYAIYDRHQEKAKILYSEFQESIKNNRLEVYLQPLQDLRQNRIVGVESLARWSSGSLGVVSPEQFIRFAEQTGLINELTRWSINASLFQCAQLRKAGHELNLAINLSARIFHQPGIVEQVQDALNTFDVPATALILEVTESAIMSDLKQSAIVLKHFRDRGMRISIDDFGCGYSSFEYLRQFPATELKIDRSFISEMTSNERARKLVRSIIDLAHHLEMVAVAEGVENQTTADMLLGMQCDFAQGYLYSPPLPATEFMAKWGI
jgi:diguanylate cyclase